MVFTPRLSQRSFIALVCVFTSTGLCLWNSHLILKREDTSRSVLKPSLQLQDKVEGERVLWRRWKEEVVENKHKQEVEENRKQVDQIHGNLHVVLDGKINYDVEKHQGEPVRNVTQVVLASSLPRSGSTFLAEVLTSHQTNNTVLFFEPLKHFQKMLRHQNGSFVPRFLSSLFTCNFDDEFEKWLKRKSLFLSYYHPNVERCFQRPKEGGSLCMKRLDLRNMCLRANIRVVKVIRSRLSWLTGLLDDSALDVKIIHLTRDPRASMSSIKKLGWKSEPSKCAAIRSDLTHYENLISKYPQRLLQVSHENICLNPLISTKAIFHFVYGSSSLGSSTRRFLTRHTESVTWQYLYNNMDTRRESWQEYDAWRWEISGQQLQEVEEEEACKDAVVKLGHVIFHSIQNTRNATIKLRRPA